MELTDLLRLCNRQQASDLHLRPGLPPILRRNGALQRLDEPPIEPPALERLLRAALPVDASRALAAHGSCDFVLAGTEVRARVHVFCLPQGLAAALRLIPDRIPELEMLGLPAALPGISDAHQGLVLITGASGSGKSTTLAALIDSFNRRRACHILTLEDPIEFVHTSRAALVTQCVARQGADALRAALRQDPDIIMLGEMRDSETIALALQAAETGHLVLSTLHTRTAVDAIARIVGVFPAAAQEFLRTQLSRSLRAVLAQTLLNSADGQTRVLAYEMLVSTPAIRNLIRENRLAQIETQLQTGRQHGMHSLRQCLDTLVASGRIAHSDAVLSNAEWN